MFEKYLGKSLRGRLGISNLFAGHSTDDIKQRRNEQIGDQIKPRDQ